MPVQALRDEDDGLVRATAIPGQTSYLVTGDKVMRRIASIDGSRGTPMKLSVTVHVLEMARSVAFYEALGLERSGEIDPMWTEFAIGGSRFALHGPAGDDLPVLGGRADVILDVPADGTLDRLIETCRSEGFSLGAEIKDIGFGRFFWVKDPDGLPVTLIERS